jgi:tRNA (guanine37-N1)-methyltransferase
LLGKAVESGKICFEIIDIRDYSEDKFRRCDDYPYGGGSGMVLMPGPLFRAIEANERKDSHVLYTSPSGIPLKQEYIKELAVLKEISIICGNYEGIDQRIIDRLVTREVSIGDYILSGGE